MSAEEKVRKIRARLNGILVVMLAVYIPFLVSVSINFDVVGTSLSSIGWRKGGLQYLICYVVLTVPMMIYQTLFFLKASDKKNRLLQTIMIIGGLCIFIGALFPVKETSPQYSRFLHCFLCQLGSVLSIVAVTYIVAMHCKANKDKTKRVAILYAGLLVFVVVSFFLLYTAAVFEIGVSLLFLFTMYLINKSYKTQLIESMEKQTNSLELEYLKI